MAKKEEKAVLSVDSTKVQNAINLLYEKISHEGVDLTDATIIIKNKKLTYEF